MEMQTITAAKFVPGFATKLVIDGSNQLVRNPNVATILTIADRRKFDQGLGKKASTEACERIYNIIAKAMANIESVDPKYVKFDDQSDAWITTKGISVLSGYSRTYALIAIKMLVDAGYLDEFEYYGQFYSYRPTA